MTDKSIYWYDFETFGSNPRRDRASQFAGIRTDENLQVIDDPLVIYCQPANDFYPSPEACLITEITPQTALEKGLNEAEFIRQIHLQFSQPDTCVAGYNSIRFDDELTRQLLYRNFFDPYEREWKGGNSRWDIIDMMRLCAAVRPEGIHWPLDKNGNISFRLELLTAANGIAHADAHDALADVHATIEMAKLVKQHQPKLYDYVFNLKGKRQVEAKLDLAQKKPIVHVSSMYPSSLGCLALVAPLCQIPGDRNGVLVYDLREDPASWLDESANEIRLRIYSKQEDLPEGVKRIPLKTLHLNRCPIVAPMSILDEQALKKSEIDLEACHRHWQLLCNSSGLEIKLRNAVESTGLPNESDPDFMIYSGGFFSEADRKLMNVIRESSPKQIAMLNLPFRDQRLPEMLFRYRARNFLDSLDSDELKRWEEYRRGHLHLNEYLAQIDTLEESRAELTADQAEILHSLRQYANTLVA